MNRAEHILDLLDCGVGLFANKFQRHMQRLGFHPARVGSEVADAFYKA